ncbi:MAG: serine acetyltransferase [Bacteroidetes bacterium]|nr:serine acetyltransferase [Bacteroidota bacterium]
MLARILYKKVLSHKLLRADLFRYEGDLSYKSFKKSLRNTGFHFTLFLRLSYSLNKYSPLGMYARRMYRTLSFKYGYQIPRATRIGAGMRISHYGPLLINSKTIIGENSYFSHNITIGETKRGERKGSPVIGSKVWIGPGVTITGKINIGDNVLIAPNSFVNIDVPSNSLVIGNPAKVIFKEDATEDYITNIYNGE